MAEFARLLTTIAEDQVDVRLLRAEPTPPWSVALEFIRIQPELEPKMTVRRDGDEAMILAGERSALEALGRNIDRFARGKLGIHMHVDYYPDHFSLRPDSVPLVVDSSSDK